MKCEIRKWKTEDAADIAAAANNKKVQHNLRDGLPFPYTEKDGGDYINAMLTADKDKVFPFAISVDGKAVGTIGAFRKENIHSRVAEIGYFIAEEYWGKGITTCAVKQLCDYIFENTDIVRLFAEPFARNAGSCRVLEKAGFCFEGVMRKYAFKNGVFEDVKLYAIIKE